ncbi:MAG: M16 family metallopeptidase, partial [Gammaproteobacteria bacterium]
EVIPGIENEYRYVQELVPAIRLDEVNAYARATIPAQSGKLVVYMGTTQSELPIPSGAQLLASVAAAEKTVVKPLDEKTLAQKLMDKTPTPGTIVAETQDKALGVTHLTLSNGVKVMLKSTDFKNDQVLISAVRFGGQSLFPEQDIFNARFASAIAGAMGLGAYSPIELQKILAGKTASAGAGMGEYIDNISGSSGSNDIETMLQFVHLKFAAVRRDETLYKSFMSRQLEAARNSLSTPEAVFRDTVTATLYNNHPRVARVLRPQDLSKVDFDRALDVYRARFSSARDLTFILVGSFDVQAIKPLLATYLASLPTPEIPVQYRDVGVRPVTGVVKKEVHSGTEPKSLISLNFTGPATYSEEESMRFSALLEVMNIRIIDVLREKLSLIYGGNMYGSISRIPYGNYAIAASLPTGPENVDKVIAATFAEIERMKTQGPDADDLNKVKQNWLQNHQKAMRENGYWLGRMQNALINGTDPASILVHEKMVNQITVDDIKAAAQRYFNTGNYVQVVLYPEKSGKEDVKTDAKSDAK